MALTSGAKLGSSLSHPNICHLYDVGQPDGASYLIMEYLDGKANPELQVSSDTVSPTRTSPGVRTVA